MPPPPMPARAAPARSVGAASTRTSTQRLLDAASDALSLRQEQLEARVRYYNSEQRTNAELDAITAQVVAELRHMTAKAPASRTSAEIEIELTQALRGLLEKLLSPQRGAFLAKKIEEVQRRITQLFFDSELYARIQGDAGEIPAASWPEQLLYFALKRHEEAIDAELEAIPAALEVRERARERFQLYLRGLCSDFLSHTTPELERLLGIYRDALERFLREEFRAELGDFSWEVIRESRVAREAGIGYKLSADQFAAFREVFDRKFLERLVLSVQGPIVKRASETTGLRDATLRFVADPRIHAGICAVINDALYDYLHDEGFLDLPPGWRRALSSE